MTKAERETLKAEYITGDYRTLKEFAEAKGLSYQEIRNIAGSEKWRQARNNQAQQNADKIVSKAGMQTVNETVRSLADRNKSKLDAFTLAEKKLYGFLNDAKNSNQIESVLRAFRNIHEMEEDILGFSTTHTDNVSVNISIADCSKDGGKQ